MSEGYGSLSGHIFVGSGDFSSGVAAVVLLVVGGGAGGALLVDDLLGGPDGSVLIDNLLGSHLGRFLGSLVVDSQRDLFSPVFTSSVDLASSISAAAFNSVSGFNGSTSFNSVSAFNSAAFSSVSAFNSAAFNIKSLIGVVDNLSLNGDVLISDLFLGDLNVFNFLFRDILGDVLPEIFNGVVVGDGDLTGDGLHLSLLLVLNPLDFLGDSLDLGLVLVFNDLLLEWDVFDPALSLDDLLSGVDGGSDKRFPGSIIISGSSDSGLHSLSVAALYGDPSSNSVVNSGLNPGLDSVSVAGALAVRIAGLCDSGGDVVGVGGGDILPGLVTLLVAVVVVADGFTGLSVDKLT